MLAWLVVYPLLLVALESVHGTSGCTLEHFRRFLGEPKEWQALWASLWISVASVVLAARHRCPLAFLFERTEFPGRRLLGALVALPVVLPPLVGVIAFLFLYGETGFAARLVQALLGLENARGGSRARGRSCWCTPTRCTSTSTSSLARVWRRLDPAALEAAAVAGRRPVAHPARG